MHLYRPFACCVMRPIIHRQCQRDQCGVKQLDRHLEAEFLTFPHCLLSKMPEQHIKYLSEYRTVAICVLISYGRFGWSSTDSKMIEIPCSGFQPIGYISDGVTSRKLTEYHAYKLTPCIVALAMLVCSRISYDLFYIFFRELCDYLREKC